MVAAKHQEVAALCHVILAFTDTARLFGCVGKLVYKVKKLFKKLFDEC